MERATIAHCCGCQRPIIRGEDFVCFKVPGSETYEFFHRRFRDGDCWDGHLSDAVLGIPRKAASMSEKGDVNGRTELLPGF
jgi:hypothetical protein